MRSIVKLDGPLPCSFSTSLHMTLCPIQTDQRKKKPPALPITHKPNSIKAHARVTETKVVGLMRIDANRCKQSLETDEQTWEHPPADEGASHKSLGVLGHIHGNPRYQSGCVPDIIVFQRVLYNVMVLVISHVILFPR